MPLTDANDLSPEPTAIPTDPPTYSPPTDGNMAAVVVTVGIVGVLMFALITWLVLRLCRPPPSQVGFSTSPSKPVRAVSDISDPFRPSFAPSEASSKFGFTTSDMSFPSQLYYDAAQLAPESTTRRLMYWDFADPDPIPGSKESQFVSYTMPKQRLPPLSPTTPTSPTSSRHSPRSKRSSMQKDESGPLTPSMPSTPCSFHFIEPPPPAYCKDGGSWPLYQPKDVSLC
ncbi:hypothetical protein PAXRUDRAFT_12771 [Paxillus rubicundulus Ve08.2h10]|uniref:Uncharacterized protein n=1 Tax=Paxillus rubicundulus Ve08.2h10 TaxID=930991 RepID=A0A0D0DV41_9AGAM|nr:hypothetical protein PAXRUDRAFT_12771 [Paxillus rubicundulus Ve08.2h10]